MRYVLVRLATAGSMAVFVACSEPTLRDCELRETQQDVGHHLDYNAVMPSNCPVDIGTIGERKFIGATVYDLQTHDYSWVRVRVTNSAGEEKGSDMQSFVSYGGLGKRAQPRVEYDAATGYSGSISPGQVLPASAKDTGIFQAVLLDGATGAQAKLLVSYRGTNVQTSIAGPDVPLSGTDGTWSASVNGGTSPYSYAWYRNGDLVSTSSTYSANVGSAEFGLRLVVTDQVTASRRADFLVDVDGIRVTISGPTLIYFSEGNATWTANIRGGYSPYTVNWHFIDGNGTEMYAGSGTTLTTYPQYEGQYQLRASVSDANGRTMSATLQVLAIGDGQGGCTPVPPQLQCDP